MQSLHTVQEEGSGQPPAYQPAVWAEEEPSAAHPAHVLPAVPVLLQVRDQLRNDTLARITETTLDPGSWSGVNVLHYRERSGNVLLFHYHGNPRLLLCLPHVICSTVCSSKVARYSKQRRKKNLHYN